MDYYLVGRVLGALLWPALIAVAIYGVGYAIAWTRPAEQATAVRRWAMMAAAAGFVATLIMSLGSLLRILRGG
jgi:hypothetical protein